VTEAEAEFFRLRQAAPVHVVSHYVMLRQETPDFGARRGFLFIGRLLEPTAPNWMGLKWFIDSCWPLIRAGLPDATLTVVGHLHQDHAELEMPGVRLVGSAVDLDPYYDRARVFVAPVRFAAGVPIKILEAAAAGLPIAGTRLMAEQVGLQPGTEIIADDEPAALAAGCMRIHEDAEAWGAMRAATQRQLDKTYSPRAFRDGLEAALGSLAPRLSDNPRAYAAK
jgi:glycosyltransferase involved in cell wall biosynthesis